MNLKVTLIQDIFRKAIPFITQNINNLFRKFGCVNIGRFRTGFDGNQLIIGIVLFEEMVW
jgi:hypothetical protein